jgi:ribonuclease-3
MNDENSSTSHNNERLEYLGDSILSTIVAEYLFKKYPNKDEGFLTKMRSKIVKRKTLNDIADNMGLDVILNEYSQGKMSKAMMGNALEALVGAIYLEFGYQRTKNYLITRVLMKYLDIHSLENYDDNYKSQLLEWCQKNGKEVDYRLLQKFKFDKRDRFKVAVTIDGKEIATAEDFNKKSAEQNASSIAIKKLHIHAAEVIT